MFDIARFDIARAALLRSGDDKVFEPAQIEPNSLEEVRRQARENWLRLRQQTIGKERKAGLQQSSGQDANENQGHSLDTDSSE